MSHQLETIIGYKFKNPKLLETALTHTSYANESRTPVQHNERLEFLGDSVLSVVVADYLFHQSRAARGELTRMRASLVSRMHCSSSHRKFSWVSICALATARTLAADAAARALSPMRSRRSLSALYLDGGMEVAKSFILPFITEGKHAEADYKTRLQEIVQQNPEERLSYVVEQESGPDHDKHFVVAVRFNSDKVARGEGRSKKMAEQHAAREASSSWGVIKEK